MDQHSDPLPVYLFIGEADFLIEEAWIRLVERIVPPKARRFNGERLAAKETSPAQVLSRVNTIPMFGKRQLLMVEHVEAWPKEERKVLQSYLDRPSPTACLVLTAAQRKGISDLESAVSKVGKVIHFSSLSEKDAPRWLQERAVLRRKRLGSLAAAFLVEQVGLDRFCLDQELEKISLYVGDRENIEIEDVRQAVSSQRTYTVFELLRYVSRNRAAQAVSSLRNLLLSGEPPLVVLALLARQIRIIWQVKDGLERGLGIADIGQRLKLPTVVMQNYAKQTSYFSIQELKRFHSMICETDLAMKSSGTAPELLLEALVLALCQQAQERPLEPSARPTLLN